MNFKLVKEFHKAFELPAPDVFTLPNDEIMWFRQDLINEEFKEVVEAQIEGDKYQIAQELADLLYVVYGTAVTYGIDIDKCFAEVHRANMSKMEDGKVLRRADGKILKGKNFQPPNMEGLV